jgi:hypothetical protein
MTFPEEFLHYLWKFCLLKKQEFKTTSGESLDIVNVGLHNYHAGPDFESAKIRIGDTLWVGNVEIHIRSSDWNRHQHQFDPAYDNVILHVVSEHDQAIIRNDGTEIPVFQIKGLIPADIAQNYISLMADLRWIPCEKQLSGIEPFFIKSWLSRILIERLEERSIQVGELLKEYKGSWDDAFYITLARNFGFKTNAVPFEMLARSLPQQLLGRYKNRAMQIEALIFGQAGFLNDKFNEDYPKMIMQEYRFLRKKHELNPVDRYLWKYMRLRPRNFPTIRLAQFAALILKSSHLFSKILNEKDSRRIMKMFSEMPVNNYWKTHYRFGKECQQTTTTLGEKSIDNILINTVAVFSFAFGHLQGNDEQLDKGLNILEKLSPESNAVISQFIKIGFIPENAGHTQALLQLKKTYCDQKKCLSCGIGIKILNHKNASTVSNVF